MILQTQPLLLMRYIGKHYFVHIAGIGIGLIVIAGLFDMVELFRRSTGKEGITPATVILMTALKLPVLIQQLLPFIILFSGLISFSKLTKAREFIIARSVGISVWQILLFPFIISLAVGVILISAFNPIAAKMYQQYETLDSKLLSLKKSTIEVSATGIWLRDQVQDQSFILNAAAVGNDQNHLKNTVFYIFDENGDFKHRLDASEARLIDNAWLLKQASLSQPGDAPQQLINVRVPSNLTAKTIEQNFTSDESMSFWDLPDYINQLTKAGFNTVIYQLKWHSLLSTPLLLGAMVLIAAIFTLRSSRTQKLSLILLGGLFTGFAFFLATHILNALGLSQKIPVILAGWLPAIIALAIAISMLIHLEDG